MCTLFFFLLWFILSATTSLTAGITGPNIEKSLHGGKAQGQAASPSRTAVFIYIDVRQTISYLFHKFTHTKLVGIDHRTTPFWAYGRHSHNVWCVKTNSSRLPVACGSSGNCMPLYQLSFACSRETRNRKRIYTYACIVHLDYTREWGKALLSIDRSEGWGSRSQRGTHE